MSLNYSRFDNLDTDSEGEDGTSGKNQRDVPKAACVDDDLLTPQDVPAAWKRFADDFPFPSESKFRKWAKACREKCIERVDEKSVFVGDCPHLIWLMQPTDSELAAVEYDCLRRLYFCDVTPEVHDTKEEVDGILQLFRTEVVKEVQAIALELLGRYRGLKPGNWMRMHMWVFFSLLMDDAGFFATGSELLRSCWWERLELAWGEWMYAMDESDNFASALPIPPP